jgi:hypothetical protein
MTSISMMKMTMMTIILMIKMTTIVRKSDRNNKDFL